jgi:hypothetical protein
MSYRMTIFSPNHLHVQSQGEGCPEILSFFGESRSPKKSIPRSLNLVCFKPVG